MNARDALVGVAVIAHAGRPRSWPGPPWSGPSRRQAWTHLRHSGRGRGCRQRRHHQAPPGTYDQAFKVTSDDVTIKDPNPANGADLAGDGTRPGALHQRRHRVCDRQS